MGRVRRGNYIFVWYKADHGPPHVHIFNQGREIAKYDLNRRQVMKGFVSRRLQKILTELLDEGVFNEIF